jgi:anti-sigma regulatory factor (Ser/Thr protein kinase)
MTPATISTTQEREAPTGDPSEHRFRFRSDAEAALAARMALYDLESPLLDGVLADLMLCVTELVTNSVRHPAVASAGEVELSIRLSPAFVHVEVGDRGPGFEPGKVRRKRGERGGWGLFIVDRLADRWGVDRRDLTWVWFEMDLGGPGARP